MDCGDRKVLSIVCYYINDNLVIDEIGKKTKIWRNESDYGIYCACLSAAIVASEKCHVLVEAKVES